jgi:hypothetical protein
MIEEKIKKAVVERMKLNHPNFTAYHHSVEDVIGDVINAFVQEIDDKFEEDSKNIVRCRSEYVRTDEFEELLRRKLPNIFHDLISEERINLTAIVK